MRDRSKKPGFSDLRTDRPLDKVNYRNMKIMQPLTRNISVYVKATTSRWLVVPGTPAPGLHVLLTLPVLVTGVVAAPAVKQLSHVSLPSQRIFIR